MKNKLPPKMNYEQKYKEALAWVESIYPELNHEHQMEAETFFPELRESEDAKIRKEFCKDIWTFIPNEKAHKYIAWLEKQGEQKSFDYEKATTVPKDFAPKKEPKFHEGDWVILTAGELSTTLQIVNVDTSKRLYWFNDSSYLPIVDEECLHHWTIQDAKDGDVLATKDTVFIFKHIDKAGLSLCKSYCEIIGNSELGLGLDFSINNVHPATKEQHDALFVKIREAGYEWDAKKKKLKKIEQKPMLSDFFNAVHLF